MMDMEQIPEMEVSLAEEGLRAAIFLDVEYFRISCHEWNADENGIFSTTRFIQAMKASAEKGFFDKVKRWKCFAYDATYRDECLQFVGEEQVRERALFHDMLKKGGFSLRLGQFVMRKGNTSVVQKGVDTQLVVDVMREHAFGKTNMFVFVTGDSDFLPVIREIRTQRKKAVLFHGDVNTINSKMLRTVNRAFDFRGGIAAVRGKIDEKKGGGQ